MAEQIRGDGSCRQSEEAAHQHARQRAGGDHEEDPGPSHVIPAFGGADRVHPYGMIYHHTQMPKTKVALTLDTGLLQQVDDLVVRQKFRNRSQAIEAALADKLHRMARTRLAREAAKLNPAEEKQLADEGLADALESWPEY